MGSFYAELHVAGHTYPIRLCTYGWTQATGPRGRVVARVRPDLIHLTLDVPAEDFLLHWAATPYQPLAGYLAFFSAKGGPVLETLSWDAGHCVGYQEEFLSGSDAEGAYVCHLTIAATTLHWQAGAPGTYAAPAAGQHGKPRLASAPVLELPVVETIATPAGQQILARLAQGLVRLLTNAPALTAALLLLPTNSRDDDGYKSEWDLSRLTQTPTDKDRARLDYLEAEQQHRPLSEVEQDELASLLAVVRKVFVGGRNGLAVYYAQKARIAAEARATDSTRGGHSYAEHGAHVTAAQHERRLRTGQKPSGVIPLKANGTPDIPNKSASFDSDEKYLETLRLADKQLQTEKINSKGGLKKKADFDVLGISNTGKAYELESLGNVTTTQVHGARAAYRLNDTTGKYELITLFPK